MRSGFKFRLPSVRRVLASALLVAAIFLLFFTLKSPVTAKNHLYGLARDVMKKSLEIRTFNWYVLDGSGFKVRYQPVDAPVARLVLETAEDYYEAVNQMLDYTPVDSVPVYIYPTKETLNESFGWDASVNAMGVYWAGTIRILSPLEWIEDEEEMSVIFRENGPMAHEYAHLVVDYKTHGNYPRWLTEGIAQYVERELTGFVLAHEEQDGEEWYSFETMDTEFDLLPNQHLAYAQSLLAVDYMVELKGFDGVLELLDELAKGQKISNALGSVLGQELADFEVSFREWVAKSS